ncbi:ABC transporter permease [Phyllobacterium sp. 628]|nr:ABC transporter permease [Phyllobacterium sp. 628]QND54101.1 ABC transporter permease [Phyllobacterium sp. 628]
MIVRITAALLAVLLCWQMAVWLLQPPRFILPAPGSVLSALIEQRNYLFANAAITVLEILLGLFFGVIAGILTALLVAALPGFGQIVWPVLLVLQALPVFAIAPLLVLWFGFGLASKVVMASLIIFFPVASAFADALRRTSQELLDAAALTQATPLATLLLVRVPSALPGLGSGLRVAAVFAPIGAVIGEWVGASRGLGFVMLQANARMQTNTLFAALIILAALTIILRFLVDAFAARLTPWVQAS